LPDQREENVPLAEVRIQRDADQTVATVVGELDMSNADEVHQQLRGAAEAGRTLRVDLSGLRFIDSAGIAVLDKLHRGLSSPARGDQEAPERADQPVALLIATAPDSVAARTLRLAGMDRVLPMVEPPVDHDIPG
jgi:ABC-type transporter Mla MlaB component